MKSQLTYSIINLYRLITLNKIPRYFLQITVVTGFCFHFVKVLADNKILFYFP